MSAIASKKTEKLDGPEKILFYMSFVFLGTIVVILILVALFSWDLFSTNVLAPIIYFLILTGLVLSFGTLLKEVPNSKKLILNWFYGFISLSFIIGIVLGVFMW
ncbi:MAG: hypothetical protein K9W44_03305 [Candidatus Lokiarchaeota archaeon]|nr:hypothetical protein [Candidatus Harpocratesius repetitus]